MRQVHKAVIRVDGKPTTVAVKVRHPGVERRIIQDFQLLIPLARATSRFKALKVCTDILTLDILLQLCLARSLTPQSDRRGVLQCEQCTQTDSCKQVVGLFHTLATPS